MEKGDRKKIFEEMQAEFPDWSICRIFNLLTKLVLELKLHVSLKYNISIMKQK
jgi:hypothetical protein